jgi:hypothetical protein
MNVVLRDASAAAPLSLVFLDALHSPDGFLENLPIGVYTCDQNDLLVQYNRRATRLVERGITQELKGSVELDFAPTGLRCLMEIPLPTFT